MPTAFLFIFLTDRVFTLKEPKYTFLFIASAAVLLLILAFTLSGTADSGDSVMHYLYARYVFNHPDNFYNAWAKPLFVLLASPFAQLGFTGIKVFNIINTIVAMVAAYLTAKKLNLANSWLVSVLLFLAPMNFALSLSGLTEPLFACLLITGLCLLLYNYSVTGLIILSFLPFVRSEGMFLLMIIAAYLVWQKKYSGILWLCTGQLLYAIAGYFHFGTLLWFYQSNPYSLFSKYGSGALLTYFLAMPIITGPASCFLLAVAVICLPLKFIKNIRKDNTIRPLILFWTLFIAYFSFHVTAWKFGLFGSFGMARIISAVSPLMIILCVYGYNHAETFMQNKLSKVYALLKHPVLLVLAINLIYMAVKFSGHIGEPGFDFTPGTDELLESKMADYIKQKYPDYRNRQVFYGAPYLSLALDIDPTGFQNPMRQTDIGKFPSKSLYVWDDWYSVVEGGISNESLLQNMSFTKDTSFSQKGGRPLKLRTVALFVKK